MSAIGLEWSEAKSLNRHALLGSIAVLAFIGGLGYWAAVTPLSGAVVAGGSVVVDGGVRRVQHQEGGIVKDILVHNDAKVSAGDILVSLDGTAIAAHLAVIDAQLADGYARQARLLAESSGASAMIWTPTLAAMPDAARTRALFDAEDRLRTTRAAALDIQVSQLDEQIVQLENQVRGLEAQHAAALSQSELLTEQADRMQSLLDQGLVETRPLTDLRSQLAQLDGEAARIVTEIARGNAAISERRLQISQTREAFLNDVLTAMQETSQQIAELEQQKIAAQDRLDRLVIRAPVDGIIHELQVATIGGVASPGEVLMQIVPQDEAVTVDVRINPLDIDKLVLDQNVNIRLSGLDARSTPELVAQVDRISPDLSRDPVTGAQFYLVRAKLSDAEMARLPDNTRLIPGMPVEAFFATGEKTVLSYLAKPMVDQLARAFRED